MHTESELRDKLRGAVPAATSRIDPAVIIRRAKVRRAPRQVAFGSVAALAVAGFTFLGVSVAPSLFSMSTGASDSASIVGAESFKDDPAGSQVGGGASNGAHEPDIDARLSARCGISPLTVAPNSLGLELTTSFPESVPADGSSVSGLVTVTNTGNSRVRGTTSVEPIVSLSRNGVTVWHTSGSAADLARHVDLEPGQSAIYSASFRTIQCNPDDENPATVGDNLPALVPGPAEVTATITYFSDTGDSFLISGPAESIILR